MENTKNIKNNKKKKIIIAVILVLVLGIVFSIILINKSNIELNNKFYDLNGTDKCNGKCLKVKLKNKNVFLEANNENIINLMQEGSHIILFYNEKDNNSRKVISVFQDTIYNRNIKEVYLYNYEQLDGTPLDGDIVNFIDSYTDTCAKTIFVVISSGEMKDCFVYESNNKSLTNKESKELRIKFGNLINKLSGTCSIGEDNC